MRVAQCINLPTMDKLGSHCHERPQLQNGREKMKGNG